MTYIPAKDLARMKQHKRLRKKDHSGILALAVLVLVFLGVAFLIASPPGSHTAGQQAAGEDAFYGSIQNIPFTGEVMGTVKADTNCKPVQNGLTNCIAIITAHDGTEIDFNYSHDMSSQQCLASGDHVTITQLSTGTVKVLRG